MMDSEENIIITIDGNPIECTPESTLLNVVVNANLKIETACGGKATCHLCRVTITEGAEYLAAPSRKEARALGNILLDKGVRLSCQIKITRTIAVSLPKYESPEERRRRKKSTQPKSRK